MHISIENYRTKLVNLKDKSIRKGLMKDFSSNTSCSFDSATLRLGRVIRLAEFLLVLSHFLNSY
jgi:hypothetical protein